MSDFTNEERIARQELFEEERHLRAVQKFRKSLRRMRKELKGGYLSGTDVGRSVTIGVVQTLRPKLERFLENLPRYKVANAERVDGMLIVKLLGIEETLGICIKAFLDTCGRESRIEASKLVATAGTRLRIEWCRRRWESMDKQAMQWIQGRYKNAGTWHKMRAASIILSKATGVSNRDLYSEIPNITYIHAAAFALEVITRHTGWFTRSVEQVSRKKNKSYIKLSDNFEQWYQENNELIENELQQLWPMLCQPKDWNSEGTDGGYLHPVGRVSKLIKAEKGAGSTVSEQQLNMINKALQRTAWEINPFVFEIQNTLFGTPGAAVGSFKPISFHPLTNEAMPDEIAALATDHPARVAWRREKKLINEANNESRREGIRTVRNIQAARLYRNEDRFWCPWSLGHNGRAYILSGGALSPQGPDAERGLLRFADGGEVTERAVYHLTLNLANLYGITDSHEAKQEWVRDNIELISAVATEPLDHISVWEQADEPWQFVAACDDYYRCVIAKTSSKTHIPVFNDATASGIQILSLLARDKDGASRVNLVPDNIRKNDIYAQLKPLLKEELQKVADEYGRPDLVDLYLPRKAYKSNLVTRIYGSVLRSRKNAIHSETLKAHNFQVGLLQPGDALLIAQCMERAMQRLAPGALRLFDNLKQLGKHCADNSTPAEWVTPVGNKVVINPLKNPIRKVSLGWFGTMSLADSGLEPYLDTKKLKTSAAPLLVHSLDAAILAQAFSEWRQPLTSCHDCVGVLATDCDEALNQMLGAYVTVLKNGRQFLEHVSETNGVEIKWSLVNTMTDEDVEAIVKCQYALC